MNSQCEHHFLLVIYATFASNNVNYFYSINAHSKRPAKGAAFCWAAGLDVLDIVPSHVSIGTFKISVVVDPSDERTAHSPTILTSTVTITMSRVVSVPMATSKLAQRFDFSIFVIDQRECTFLVVCFCIAMPTILRSDIIYVISRQVYALMNLTWKDIVLKTVHIVHTLMVPMIYGKLFWIVERYRTVIWLSNDWLVCASA